MTLAANDPLVPFSLLGADGKTYGPDSAADAPVLVVIFWCNHCPYVQAWEGRVLALQREFADRGVRFLLINANDPVKYPADSYENMKVVAREKQYPCPYLWDETQEVARAYGAARTPEVFVFDRDRKLRYHGSVDDNYDDPAKAQPFFRNALEALVADRAPELPETPPRGCMIKWR